MKLTGEWSIDEAYRIKIFNIKRGTWMRSYKMMRKQLQPCIIPHHYSSLSILNQLQATLVLLLNDSKNLCVLQLEREGCEVAKDYQGEVDHTRGNKKIKTNLMYEVIFSNCCSTKAVSNINKSWQSPSCQTLERNKEISHH